LAGPKYPPRGIDPENPDAWLAREARHVAASREEARDAIDPGLLGREEGQRDISWGKIQGEEMKAKNSRKFISKQLLRYLPLLAWSKGESLPLQKLGFPGDGGTHPPPSVVLGEEPGCGRSREV
jgi:hypothetical protein